MSLVKYRWIRMHQASSRKIQKNCNKSSPRHVGTSSYVFTARRSSTVGMSVYCGICSNRNFPNGFCMDNNVSFCSCKVLIKLWKPINYFVTFVKFLMFSVTLLQTSITTKITTTIMITISISTLSPLKTLKSLLMSTMPTPFQLCCHLQFQFLLEDES